MDKQQIINYIMTSPSNTNPAILGHFLDEFGNSEGSSNYSIYNITINSTALDEKYLSASVQINNNYYCYIPLDNGIPVESLEIDLTNGIINQNLQIMAFNTQELSYELYSLLDDNTINIETTGNITYHYDEDSGIYFLITGNGTITISQ